MYVFNHVYAASNAKEDIKNLYIHWTMEVRSPQILTWWMMDGEWFMISRPAPRTTDTILSHHNISREIDMYASRKLNSKYTRPFKKQSTRIDK